MTDDTEKYRLALDYQLSAFSTLNGVNTALDGKLATILGSGTGVSLLGGILGLTDFQGGRSTWVAVLSLGALGLLLWILITCLRAWMPHDYVLPGDADTRILSKRFFEPNMEDAILGAIGLSVKCITLAQGVNLVKAKALQKTVYLFVAQIVLLAAIVVSRLLSPEAAVQSGPC